MPTPTSSIFRHESVHWFIRTGVRGGQLIVMGDKTKGSYGFMDPEAGGRKQGRLGVDNFRVLS